MNWKNEEKKWADRIKKINQAKYYLQEVHIKKHNSGSLKMKKYKIYTCN